MKKIYLLSLFILSHLVAFAQYDGPAAPSYKQIKKEIDNIESPLFYGKLMARYEQGDSTMTIEEQRHLYYGYVYQPNYNPIDDTEYNTLISSIIGKGYFQAGDTDKVKEYANLLLSSDPFNMRALNALLLVYAEENNASLYRKTAIKRNIVERAIVSSGDGISKKTRYYVIKVAHEYDILPFLGFTYGGSERFEKRCKCNSVKLGQNHFGIERLYFDITPVLNFAGKKGRSVI